MVLEDTIRLGANDTIIAPATIAGTGAISVIRISGPDALAITDSMVEFRSGSACSTKAGRVKYGQIHFEGALLDEVLCSIFRAPHSYTGEDSVEISCHASAYIVNTILQMACGLGARVASPGEFTRRAFMNGKMDLTQAEAVADIIASSDKASHDVAMNQLRGGFSAQLRDLRAQLLHMTALLELELDFSEEDVEFAGREQLRELLDKTCAKVEKLAGSFKLGNALKNGVPVAIVGAPNSGKSTLLNAILGDQRAIVSDIAGTTRDTIEETFVADGVRFRLVDTAGIRHSDDAIEKIGIQRSFEAIDKADIVIVVIDLSNTSNSQIATDFRNSGAIPNGKTNSFDDSLEPILSHCLKGGREVFFALNKADIFDNFDEKDALNKFVTIISKGVLDNDLEGVEYFAKSITSNTITISAKAGSGVDNLVQKIANCAQKRHQSYGEDAVLVTNARHHAALLDALSALRQVRTSLDLSLPTDLIAEDLRTALSSLGSITGEISTDEVLGEIFGKFCIGK